MTFSKSGTPEGWSSYLLTVEILGLLYLVTHSLAVQWADSDWQTLILGHRSAIQNTTFQRTRTRGTVAVQSWHHRIVWQFRLTMLRAQEEDENEEPLGKISCTAEIRAAFILSSFVFFITGLMILFICRLLWRVFRKWRTIKGTGIILVSLIPDPFLWDQVWHTFVFG